ncbi:MAG: hypothetical protein IKT75_04480, partial [Alistipes sp.]|nr:hypothetical protein [Alistipes sp.]
DLYDKTITIDLITKIRDEQRFGSVEELRNQLTADAAQCLMLEASEV